MNETEIQKALVKAAFNSGDFPNFGLQNYHKQRQIMVRKYLQEISGYLSDQPAASQSPFGAKSKKYALVAVYKMWSAFTKGLKY